MKTMIVYASKYGCAESCAQTLSKKLEGSVKMVNIGKEQAPSLAEYDQVIIGGSIYMGRIQKPVKEFCEKNVEALKGKKVGLFMCCGFPENLEQHMQNAFPKELLDMAVAKESFGGELNPAKMKFFDKMITKMVSKSAEKEGKKPPLLAPEKIGQFAQVMNGV